MNWTLTAWLQALEMADVPAYAAAVGLVAHVPFNYLFIYAFGWGYLGCAVATVTFQLIQPALILIYLFGTRSGQDRVLRSCAADSIDRRFGQNLKRLSEGSLDLLGPSCAWHHHHIRVVGQ